MQKLVEKMLNDFERGVLSRRQLAATLTGLAAVAAMPATPALAAPSLKAITLNHVTVRVPDLQKTSKFYQDFFGMKLAQHSETIHILGVGESFFGIEQKPGGAALDHYDFGLEGWAAK
ncbi:MAG TPA: VOC family protein, partial [Rhizomicrobium sp.]|nr:VOC family protein [Rhizomicrobium sp.]